MALDDFTRHQQGIIKRYYANQDAIQLHGAIGTTDELALGGYAKRLIVYELLFGSTREHLRRYGAMIADPQDPNTFYNSKLNWSEVDQAEHRRVLDLYKRCLKFRRDVLIRRGRGN